MVYVSTLMALL